MPPTRQRADQEQDQEDDENGAKHDLPPFVVPFTWRNDSSRWRVAAMIEPVRPIALGDIEDARKRIAGTVLRTPLVKLDLGSDAIDIYLKLENLQPIGAYKLRGAANALARLSDDQRARGVWTISAGNAGQGVAFAARKAGVPCSIVAIETAPQTKLDRMRALGARIVTVSYEVAWRAAEAHAFEGMVGTFIH